MSKSIRLPFYGMRHDGRTIFVINTISENRFGLIAKTYISELTSLSIEYDNNCAANTYDAPDMVAITRKEFLLKVKEVKDKYKIQITIKY